MPYRSREPITLQRRHFEFIARTLAKLPSATLKANMALHFARECKATNDKFNVALFFTAVTGDKANV